MKSMVSWEDPPPPDGHNSRGVHKFIAEDLRMNPWVWAKVGEYSSRNSAYTLASQIRRGNNAAYLPAGRFEATTRASKNERYSVYARYVGDDVA